MLTFRLLTLEDRALVERYTKESRLSFHRFTNMFMWRHVMNCRICEDNGILYVLNRYRDYPQFAFFPFCEEGREAEGLERLLQAVPDLLSIRPVSREQAELICTLDPHAHAAPARNQWDYLYRTADLISLSGRKYHTKKNHLNVFTATYHWQYIDIRPDSPPADQERLMRAAMHLASMDERMEDEEQDANLELITHLSDFGLRAAVLEVEGTPVAYSVGEQILPDTALIHIEKADRTYRGAYAAINQMFASYAWNHLEWINREEDMGIEGLRLAKTSYHPARMNEVQTIRLHS